MAISPKDPTKPFLVIVTGLSGAGLSTAVNTLQDNGFYCVDNLPIEMIWNFVELIESGKYKVRGFAVVMDIRDRSFASDFPALKSKLAQRLRLDVLFLNADPSVVAIRYGSTRRKHPLLTPKGNLLGAIRKESEMLQPVEKSADVVFDTSSWSPHYLSRMVESRYYAEIPPRSLYLTITSFGFKYGQLRPLDMMFDVRFLPNPHFVMELKEQSGLDPGVRDFVLTNPMTKEFFQHLEGMHRFLLPHYFNEGKHYLRVGIGCTGGRHRSVAIAEELARVLSSSPIENIIVNISHRDVDNH